jgi:phosphohistidine phosphatase
VPTLALLRHAKSAWPEGVDDRSRPLTERGTRDAAAAGTWLVGRALVPDVALVSPARRAQLTWAEATLAAAELADVPTTPAAQVYAASAWTLLQLLQRLDDSAATVVLVGHCPGVEDLTHLLAGTAEPSAAARLAGGYPTCGLAVLELPGPWRSAGPGSAHLADFAVPRAH